jgi:F-type H+-transporting ATPase subunit epsilon
MKMTLVTPEKKLVSGADVDEIFVPGFAGELNILPGHSPLITVLQLGALRYRETGKQTFQSVVISWGYCQVNPEGVNILAETAERPEEIDVKRAEASMKNAETMMLSDSLDEEARLKYAGKLARASIRVDIGNQREH